ncbi:MAG: fatty-acid oxidation protein subunit alpha [Moorea sp. SIO1F2]|uniref:XisH family protein n=1 Tax=Moorena sp. SIO1F2 TaxID=2607819 RepID=UPI0013BB1A04|nr:XisH family protein [Moorena sp. SIO1F2]NET81011.1 fatty-acid oxidation protein subunit alpha [Moorena sp. SIO1F2]
MPAKDIFHNTVRLALEKDGWLITKDPLYIKVGGSEMYIDLAAEQLIAAQKDNQSIAVEIKSFLQESEMSEFHVALGQFLNYRLALKQTLPNFVLYLAVPTDTYNTFFRRPFIQDALEEYQLKLLIFDPKTEEISSWKP